MDLDMGLRLRDGRAIGTNKDIKRNSPFKGKKKHVLTLFITSNNNNSNRNTLLVK